MLTKLTIPRFFFLGLVGIFLLAGCKNGDTFERTRSEYEYVPPVMLPKPVPVVPVVSTENTRDPAASEDALSDEEPAEKKTSFFGRLFSRNNDKDGQAEISRVGDTPEVFLDEEGNPVENTHAPDKVYRLKIGDAVYINLSGSGGLNEQIETVIDDEGSIKLRFIGSVKANDLSSTELEREIETEYTVRQKIYKDVTVRVLVPNTFYFIGGEIRQPGRFPLVGRVTLNQAVVAAGNFTEWANERVIILVRNNERVVIDFRRIRQDPNLDVELLAGDVINVGRSTF